MKYLFGNIAVLFLLLNGLFCVGQENGIRKMYVGTFTSEGAEGIYLCNFNTSTGEISLDKTLKGFDNPAFLKISPDKKYLYVVSRPPVEIEQSMGYVSAYQIKPDGTIHFLNKQIGNGEEPCHVDVSADGKYVAIAAYGGGTTSLFPVLGNGSLAPVSTVNVNKGPGFDKSRQDKPHAHSIKFSPFNKQVFSADLGTDQLDIYTLENGKLIDKGQKFVKLAPGAGPRHFDFHPDGNVIFVINELNSTITTLKMQGDEWKIQEVISTLPKDFKGVSYCADIHVSADGKFLYGSNRGHNSVAVFSIEKDTKKLKNLGFVSVEGDWPRNFAISPDGKFMLVANQKSGNISVFKINPATGIPEFNGNEIKLPSPVCIEFL